MAEPGEFLGPTLLVEGDGGRDQGDGSNVLTDRGWLVVAWQRRRYALGLYCSWKLSRE